MAAGRFDVSKRRDYHGGSGKDQGGDHIRGRGNSYRSSSSVRKFEFRRSGFSCANEERKMDHSFSLERSRRFEDVDEVQIRLEKKRKFSHDICDELEDKNLSGSSWNRVDLASTNSSPVPSSDVGATKYPFMGSRVVELGSVTDKDCVEKLKSPTVLSSLLPLERDGDHDEQQDDHGENVFPETRNLSMSRWASEDDSPGNTSISDEEDMQGKVVHKMSSPESGEVISEASGGILTRSSGFNRCGSRDENSNNELENDEIMDYEKLQGSNVSVIQMDSDDKFSQIDESTASTERSINMLQGCRSVFEFERLDEINEGTYGKVYKARDRTSGELVALKKVKMNVGGSRNLEEYGFPLSALREINILLSFQHPSIVNVKEVVMDDLNGVFMVMEYMEHDLKGFMQSMKRPFSTSEVKCLMLQLLEGVKYLHDNWVIHRDLKTSNLLLNNQGELKICDFGMSRQYGSPLKPYTSLVVTLWYRAPELLLGAKQYSTAIDMWSVGCIMAELLAKEPLFKGKTEIDQLDKIFRVLGTPNGTEWPGLSKLPGAKANFVKLPYKDVLRNKFPAASFTGFSVLSDLGFDLLKKLLTFDPEKRITVDAALKHPWFREDPEPKSKECMPTFPPQYARNRILQRTMERSDTKGSSGGR